MINHKPKFIQHLLSAIGGFKGFMYQDIFTVDSFRYTEDHDIEVIYHITGKRKPFFCKRISQIISDSKLYNCFSRKDLLEIGVFYGQLKEKIFACKNENPNYLKKES